MRSSPRIVVSGFLITVSFPTKLSVDCPSISIPHLLPFALFNVRPTCYPPVCPVSMPIPLPSPLSAQFRCKTHAKPPITPPSSFQCQTHVSTPISCCPLITPSRCQTPTCYLPFALFNAFPGSPCFCKVPWTTLPFCTRSAYTCLALQLSMKSPDYFARSAHLQIVRGWFSMLCKVVLLVFRPFCAFSGCYVVGSPCFREVT